MYTREAIYERLIQDQGKSYRPGVCPLITFYYVPLRFITLRQVGEWNKVGEIGRK